MGMDVFSLIFWIRSSCQQFLVRFMVVVHDEAHGSPGCVGDKLCPEAATYNEFLQSQVHVCGHVK